jgi:hypothetical protein
MEILMITEYLVTGQGYEKNDPYKQNTILYDTFDASDDTDAKKQFDFLFSMTHKITKIYSAIKTDTND